MTKIKIQNKNRNGILVRGFRCSDRDLTTDIVLEIDDQECNFEDWEFELCPNQYWNESRKSGHKLEHNGKNWTLTVGRAKVFEENRYVNWNKENHAKLSGKPIEHIMGKGSFFPFSESITLIIKKAPKNKIELVNQKATLAPKIYFDGDIKAIFNKKGKKGKGNKLSVNGNSTGTFYDKEYFPFDEFPDRPNLYGSVRNNNILGKKSFVFNSSNDYIRRSFKQTSSEKKNKRIKEYMTEIVSCAEKEINQYIVDEANGLKIILTEDFINHYGSAIDFYVNLAMKNTIDMRIKQIEKMNDE